MRVQRTRSLPSAPHSPLTRCPLGGRGLTLLFLILLAAGCVSSGKGDAVVRLVDQEGAALPLTVPVRMGGLCVDSDVKGVAHFSAVPAGRYDVRAELDGFMACPTTLRVKAGATVTLALEMRIGSIAMIGIVGKDGTLVGSYCQAEYPPCPGKPWSAVVVKPPGAEEIEKLAK